MSADGHNAEKDTCGCYTPQECERLGHSAEKDAPAEGDLMVWYVPQMPMKAFKVAVPDLATGVAVFDALTAFSLFEYENRVKPDYSDAGGICRWETDGDGGFDWFDVAEDEIAASVIPPVKPGADS